MARRCEICGKGRQVGYHVSHAHNKNKKVWQANLQSIRAELPGGGTKRMLVCTRCLRTGVVKKAVHVPSADTSN